MALDKTISKKCNCKNQAGKRLGIKCPKLTRADGTWNYHHGVWALQVELPPAADGTRRQYRRSGFTTSKQVEAERDRVHELIGLGGDQQIRTEIGDIIADLKAGQPLPDRDAIARRVRAGVAVYDDTSTGAYLDEWLANRRVSENTLRSYSDHIRMYFKPGFGHIPLQKLRTAHIQAVFNNIDAADAALLRARNHPDQAVRDTVKGKRVRGAASQQRFLATIRKALNDAIGVHKLIEYNPALHVELASGAPPKPQLWTDAAVTRWRKTGRRPSPVMVWTPAQLGTFLDHAADHQADLHDMFELIAHRGLRRGEACGLGEHDVDLHHQQLTIHEQIASVAYKPVLKKVKSRAGDRTVPLADDTTASLRRYNTRRKALKLKAGTAWVDSGRFFIRDDGSAWHPERISQIFDNLTTASGLPPIRLHDLRHCAATLMLAAGATLKEIQETLGHANYQITADTYTSVLEELQKTTAEKATKLVPRTKRPRGA
ncbi:site-specific integrase [Pilimelia terevasa]|uniref:Site-specific integrase n=1 Tax=Pilimelia terevasa TaxID=53372 RepID=A0A8J3FLY9_9ACTN|nr:tyrosine-type recombinase/integrase [Pilimelia terevasa]GGK40613.1 site-specific integrase [Pilimelia terevasa]